MLVAVEHVPIATNPETRDSRLVDSTARYVRRNAVAVFRAYVLYEPLRVFTIVAAVLGARRARRLDAVPARLDPARRPNRPHPVADPGRGPGPVGGSDVRARRGRGRDRRPAGDRPANLRASPPAGARERNRALPLRGRQRDAGWRWRNRGIRSLRARAGPKRGRRLSATAAPAAERGGNVYDKYGTRNPVERRLVGGFLQRLEQLVERTGVREAHEVGCGEGELAIRLARRGLRVRGSDVSSEVIDEARRRADAAGGRDRVQGGSDRGARSRPGCRRADRLLRGHGAPRRSGGGPGDHRAGWHDRGRSSASPGSRSGDY